MVRLLVLVYFRHVEVHGLEDLPEDGGAVLVSWHPNALLDPALIFAFSPRPVIFGARHGLFRWPLLGTFLRRVGTVPIYRPRDRSTQSEEERRAANRRSVDALAQAVADGGVSCLFPEGFSHDASQLQDLRSGAARLYYRARQLGADAGPAPVVVPVGLHYDAKRRFRSHALVTFHPPIALPADLDRDPLPEDSDSTRSLRERGLTELMGHTLRHVVHPTDSWRLHHLLHRARTLLRAERSHRAGVELPLPTMMERQVGFSRMWAGHDTWRQSRPAELARLLARLDAYDRDLDALGIHDADLDRPRAGAQPLQMAFLAAQVTAVYLVTPALLVLGGVVNALPYFVLRAGTAAVARHDKDHATLMLGGGLVLYPTAWAIAAYVGSQAAPWLHAHYPLVPESPALAALVVVVLAIAGGMVGLRYARRLRTTANAVRVRLTRARRRVAVARLRVERGELHDALRRMMDGMDLPGSVTADGVARVTEEVPPGGHA